MRPALLAPLLILAIVPAWAGRKKDAPEPVPVRAPKAPLPLRDPLPVDVGRLPDGLANLSAQGCHACHVGPAEGWLGSAHAKGVTPALARAAEAAGDPACLSCHLPLQQQHALQPDGQANPAWSATLQSEGVTCVACHLTDGVIVGAHPAASPHTSGTNPGLAEASFCASCHQLTWPGASAPLYDTFGEWSRSGWSAAGVTCQDCHMGPGAASVRLGSDHAMQATPARALSVLLQPDAPTLVRGSEGISVSLTVQNTGAGHHVPSGSPHTAMVIEARLVPPSGDGQAVSLFTTELGQTFEDAPPWTILTDTRIAAGAAPQWTFPAALEHSAEAGAWWLEVRITRTTNGEVADAPAILRRVPLRVQ